MSQSAEPPQQPDLSAFPSPPDVFAATSRVLEALGLTELFRHGNLVEFCREGDEGSAATVILHDNPYLDWPIVLATVSRSDISVEDFLNAARTIRW